MPYVLQALNLIFSRANILQGACQRFALPALGWGRRSRPTGKMIRRRKLLGICAESPASGARFVGTLLTLRLVYVETGFISRQRG
jgi:hypothetical protein